MPPPVTITVGTFTRAAAIRHAGSILSQEASKTIPST